MNGLIVTCEYYGFLFLMLINNIAFKCGSSMGLL